MLFQILRRETHYSLSKYIIDLLFCCLNVFVILFRNTQRNIGNPSKKKCMCSPYSNLPSSNNFSILAVASRDVLIILNCKSGSNRMHLKQNTNSPFLATEEGRCASRLSLTWLPASAANDTQTADELHSPIGWRRRCDSC